MPSAIRRRVDKIWILSGPSKVGKKIEELEMRVLWLAPTLVGALPVASESGQKFWLRERFLNWNAVSIEPMSKMDAKNWMIRLQNEKMGYQKWNSIWNFLIFQKAWLNGIR